MSSVREVLEQYVSDGKLMQVASLRRDGTPVVCNVWYDAHFAPDVLRFISRHDRVHSENVRAGGHVAGGIIAIELEGLGQKARGVTFTGRARELPTVGIDAEIAAFVRRWPRAGGGIDPVELAAGRIPNRLYEIAIDEWVLFDEANFPDEPRQVLRAG